MLVSRREDQRPLTALAPRAPIPWKNGGGVTTEVFVFPAGATLETFELRVSRARVEKDGPFSFFPGVDRSLVVLEGDGMELDVEGTSITLRAGDAPFVFAGERAITASLLGGPLTDFNVMTRRSALRHELSWQHVKGEASFAPGLIAIVEGALGDLRSGDAAWIDAPITLRGDARVLYVALTPA